MGFDAKSLIHIAALTFTGCVTTSKLDNGSKSIGVRNGPLSPLQSKRSVQVNKLLLLPPLNWNLSVLFLTCDR